MSKKHNLWLAALLFFALIGSWLLVERQARPALPDWQDAKGMCERAFDTSVQAGQVTNDKRGWWVGNCLGSFNKAADRKPPDEQL